MFEEKINHESLYEEDLNIDLRKFFHTIWYRKKLIIGTFSIILTFFILMTFTSPMCPMASFIQGEVQEKVSQVEGVKNVNIEVTFEPQWQPSDELKMWLGF